MTKYKNEKQMIFKAFSLIELSVVLIIIGFLISGVLVGKKIIAVTDVVKAKSLTKSSPVNGMDNLVVWVESVSTKNFLKSEAVNNQAVSTWYDINPQSTFKKNFTQSEPTDRPLYISSAINGFPAIRFDGDDDFLETQVLNINEVADNSQITIFAVLNMIEVGSGAFFAMISGSNRVWLDTYLWDIPSTSGRDGYGVNLGNLGNIVFTAIKDSSSQSIYINGDLLVSQSNTLSFTPFSESIQIGGAYTPHFTNVDLGEVIVFSRALSEFERKEVENYLVQKWKIK